MNTRTEIVKLMGENREALQANLSDLWRRNAEDLIAAGLPAGEVVETMITVAMVQGMKVSGATVMANYLRSCADKFDFSADCGVEYPAPEPAKH